MIFSEEDMKEKIAKVQLIDTLSQAHSPPRVATLRSSG